MADSPLHPRRHRLGWMRTWSGLAVCCACVLAWVASWFWAIALLARHSAGLAIKSGRIYGGYWPGATNLRSDFSWGREYPYWPFPPARINWGFNVYTYPATNVCVVYVPLWAP